MVRWLYIFLCCITLVSEIQGVRYAMRIKKDPLSTYRTRRNLRRSHEPRGTARKREYNIFVVQKHDASHLHYDFRLAIGGVLVSWAVPKGIPRRAGIKRLAMRTDDHPLEYADFEGTIPAGNYGAGTVEIWDHGSYKNEKESSMQRCLKKGVLEFSLSGSKLKGIYVLVRMENKPNQWLLMKKKVGN